MVKPVLRLVLSSWAVSAAGRECHCCGVEFLVSVVVTLLVPCGEYGVEWGGNRCLLFGVNNFQPPVEAL